MHVLHRLSRRVVSTVTYLRVEIADQGVDNSEAFICRECDVESRWAGFSHGEYHLAKHNLVRCMKAEEEGLSSTDDETQKRIRTLEDKLDGLTGQLERLIQSRQGDPGPSA